jgi:hypothetical protein
MYLVLTNAAEQHSGSKIALKKDLVVAVHSTTEEKEPNVFVTKTYLFVPPHGTWEVTESLEQVVKQLNS